MLYLHAKFDGDPPLHGGVRKKSSEFLFFIVAFSNVLKDIWTIPQGGATFALELGQNLTFIVKIRRA